MDSARQAGVDGGGAGQAGVDCDGAEPAGAKEPPEGGDVTGEFENDEEQEADPPVPLLEQPLIIDGKHEWRARPQLRARSTGHAGGGSGLTVDRTAGPRGPHAALGQGRLRQSRGVGRARPVWGIDKDRRQALGGSWGRPRADLRRSSRAVGYGPRPGR